MSSFNVKVAFGLVLVALCISNWIEAQKTAANSFQRQVGSNSNSVYGGYQQQPQQQSPVQRQRDNSLVAPVNQQRRTSYSTGSRQQSAEVPRQPSYQQTQISASDSSSYESSQQAEADAEPASYGSVNGQPGQDFPAYTRVPKTSFSCDGLPYDYGMYADEETGCQAYHVCYNGRKDSFLCGVGTVFNQRILHCDYWYSVDCGKSSQYYSSNAYMGSSQPEPGPAQANAAPAAPRPQSQQSSYSGSSSVSSSSYNRPANVQRPSSSANQPTSAFRDQTQQQIQENY